jgi:uncharacterized protein (TIGR02466 family)
MNNISLFSSQLTIVNVKENTDYVKSIDFEFLKTNTYFKSYMSKDHKVLNKFPFLKQIILDHFYKFAKDTLRYQNNFKITTSWITEIEGEYSEFHHHKNSMFSGVYYFDEYSDDSGHIEFKNPLGCHSDFWLVPDDWNMANSLSYYIKPHKNLLIFFPSYLEHRICNNKETRRSLAFNIVPIPPYGHSDSLVT